MKQKLIVTLLCGVLILSVVPSLAQRPDAPEYALRGEYGVGTTEFVIEDDERPLNVTVWYPAVIGDDVEEAYTYRDGLVAVDGRAVFDAPLDTTLDEPFAVILFSHGSGGMRYQSLFYTEHLASQGFVVMAVNHPGNTILDSVSDPEAFAANIMVNYALRPLDILRLLDFAEALNADSQTMFANQLDLSAIGVTGHSFGGYTAMSIGGGQLDFSEVDAACAETEDPNICRFANGSEVVAELRNYNLNEGTTFPPTTDPRIAAVVLLAPAGATTFSVESLEAVELPVMTIVGSADSTTPPETQANVIHEGIGSDQKILITLENAGHYVFVDKCNDLALAFDLFGSCSDLVWDMDRAQDIVNHYTTAFFRSVLLGDDAATAILDTDQDAFVGVDYQD